MNKATLTIKTEMQAIDTKNRTWYNSLTDEEKKSLNIWVLTRYLSSVKHSIKDFETHYIEWTNELINTHSNILRTHPELQFKLMQVVGLGKAQFHPWLAPGKRGKDNKVLKWVKEHNLEWNDDECDLYISLTPKEEIQDLMLQHGMELKEVKKLFK